MMGHIEVSEHFTEQVVKIGSTDNSWQEFRIDTLRLGEVKAVIMRIVKVVSLEVPDVAVHFLPISPLIYANANIWQIQRPCRLVRGDRGEFASLLEQYHASVRCQREALNAIIHLALGT